MKKLLFFLGVILFTSCDREYKKNERLPFGMVWKFNAADDPLFASLKYNDSNWPSIQSGVSWQNQGFDYVGFAWYRAKIYIPSSIKDSQDDSLKIFLGEISDPHQVYLNGDILAENGIMVKSANNPDSTFIDLPSTPGEKKYIICKRDHRLRYDEENLIAIRFFNKKNNGGIVSGKPHIAMLSLEDRIDYNKSFYEPDSIGNVDTNLIMKNNYNKEIAGQLYIDCKIKKNGMSFFKTKVLINLKPEESKSIPISLPTSIEPIEVSLNFKESSLKKIVSDSLIVPFVLMR